MMEAVQKVAGNLLAPLSPLTESDDAPLQIESQLIERCKQAALLCAGVAVQRFEKSIAEQQEVLGLIADMTIELYAAESALLRTQKYLDSGEGETEGLRLDMTRAWCRELPEKIERFGATLLAASVEGDALTTPLAGLKKLMRVTPINTVTLKRQVAAAATATTRYPL